MLKNLKRKFDKKGTRGKIIRLKEDFEQLKQQIDLFKSRVDVSDELFEEFQKDRVSDEYNKVYEKDEPLVTVCVGTYNRARLLLDRSIKSILAQDYENLQLIVVGDCCTDETEKLISTIEDERLHFVNLSERGNYPEDPDFRWMVAGTATVNHALELAKGDFITHLDDDDEYTPDRIGKLIQFIKETKADIVWHPFWVENPDGSWKLNKSEEYKAGRITTSSVLYHRWFKKIPWDINAYKYREPGDWNRFRKIKYLGVRACRYSEPLLKHYKERNQ
ncbi:MAG: glycosyltransferase family 2 protein [bacterium]|nr:glycosyltransferase family 2 protein [bacterium]